MSKIGLEEQVVVVLLCFFGFVTCHMVLHYCHIHKLSWWISTIPYKSICLFNATIFAIICGFGGIYVWYFPTNGQIESPLYGSSLLQEVICLVGVSYFIYDLLIVLLIDPSMVYLIHALLGIVFGYLGGVVPLASHAGSFVMAYEISTPFKNIRYFMIKWGLIKKNYILFRLIEIGFILSFYYLRLVIGLPAMVNVTKLFLIEIKKMNNEWLTYNNTVNNNNNSFDFTNNLSLRFYGTYFLLVGGWFNVILNLYWSFAIFKAMVLFGRKKGDYAPNDEDEIIYENDENNCNNNSSNQQQQQQQQHNGKFKNGCAMKTSQNQHYNITAKTNLNFLKNDNVHNFGHFYFGELYSRLKCNNSSNSNNNNNNNNEIYEASSSMFDKLSMQIGCYCVNLTQLEKREGSLHRISWFYYLLQWNRLWHFGNKINNNNNNGESLVTCVKKLLQLHLTEEGNKSNSTLSLNNDNVGSGNSTKTDNTNSSNSNTFMNAAPTSTPNATRNNGNTAQANKKWIATGEDDNENDNNNEHIRAMMMTEDNKMNDEECGLFGKNKDNNMSDEREKDKERERKESSPHGKPLSVPSSPIITTHPSRVDNDTIDVTDVTERSSDLINASLKHGKHNNNSKKTTRNEEDNDSKLEIGDIYLMTILGSFNLHFNPLCIYYCFDGTNSFLKAILFETSNKHVFVLPLNGHVSLAKTRQTVHFLTNLSHSNVIGSCSFAGLPTEKIINMLGKIAVCSQNGGNDKEYIKHDWGTSSTVNLIENSKNKNKTNGSTKENDIKKCNFEIEFGLYNLRRNPIKLLSLLRLFFYFPFLSCVLNVYYHYFRVLLFGTNSSSNDKTIKNEKNERNGNENFFYEIIMFCFGLFGLIILKTFNMLSKCGGAIFGRGSKNKDVLFNLNMEQFNEKN